MSNKPHPVNIVLHKASHELEIEWDSGDSFTYPAELLRVFSPSAEVRGHWGQGAKLQVDKQDVNIEELREFEAEKLISEDDLFKGRDQVQELTDQYVAQADEVGQRKEEEIREV